MVVVATHHAVDAVDAGAFPFALATRHDGVLGEDVSGQGPAAVGFEVGFVDQVDAVLVAQFVPAFLVRVVRGADGVDVVALAEDHVIDHVLLGDGAAAFGVELVAVGALEHDALAVDGQDAVLDAEAAETDLLGRAFDDVARLVDDVDVKLVQRRAFGAPRGDALQRPAGDRGLRLRHTVLPSASFRVARTVAASAALSTVSAASREAVPASGSQSASICVFSMCTCGRAASSTERNRPCRRQKS